MSGRLRSSVRHCFAGVLLLCVAIPACTGVVDSQPVRAAEHITVTGGNDATHAGSMLHARQLLQHNATTAAMPPAAADDAAAVVTLNWPAAARYAGMQVVTAAVQLRLRDAMSLRTLATSHVFAGAAGSTASTWLVGSSAFPPQTIDVVAAVFDPFTDELLMETASQKVSVSVQSEFNLQLEGVESTLSVDFNHVAGTVGPDVVLNTPVPAVGADVFLMQSLPTAFVGGDAIAVNASVVDTALDANRTIAASNVQHLTLGDGKPFTPGAAYLIFVKGFVYFANISYPIPGGSLALLQEQAYIDTRNASTLNQHATSRKRLLCPPMTGNLPEIVEVRMPFISPGVPIMVPPSFPNDTVYRPGDQCLWVFTLPNVMALNLEVDWSYLGYKDLLYVESYRQPILAVEGKATFGYRVQPIAIYTNAFQVYFLADTTTNSVGLGVSVTVTEDAGRRSSTQQLLTIVASIFAAGMLFCCVATVLRCYVLAQRSSRRAALQGGTDIEMQAARQQQGLSDSEFDAISTVKYDKPARRALGMRSMLSARLQVQRSMQSDRSTRVVSREAGGAAAAVAAAAATATTTEEPPNDAISSIRGRTNDFDDHDACAICLAEFEVGEALKSLPQCNHLFHSDCIKGWLSRNVHCPLCKRNVLETLAPVLQPQPSSDAAMGNRHRSWLRAVFTRSTHAAPDSGAPQHGTLPRVVMVDNPLTADGTAQSMQTDQTSRPSSRHDTRESRSNHPAVPPQHGAQHSMEMASQHRARSDTRLASRNAQSAESQLPPRPTSRQAAAHHDGRVAAAQPLRATMRQTSDASARDRTSSTIDDELRMSVPGTPDSLLGNSRGQ